jgi:hypothetical protein
VFTPERNPFEVLRLDPTASEEEVVRRAAQLRRRASDEAAVTELRRAVQLLTGGRPEDRQLLSLLTHPRPGYAAPALERFAAAFRRPPAAAEAPEQRLELDLAEFAGCMALSLAEELDSPQLPFEPVAAGDDAGEIGRQTDEVLWQSLIIDSGA